MRYSSYKTGILEIDIQHSNIDFLLSELAKEGLGKEVKEKSYETLKNALSLHFSFEEKWAQKNNRNFDSDHKNSHKKLLEKLGEFGNQYTSKKLNMYEISLAFQMELLKHVQDHDMKLGTRTE
ncbi:MAG: hypothetical protein GY777_22385 [Candidatus Brocadiaceae bacterium]|nr:hypothetical protein [Candidatus Brocadiaceae bacterium]